MPKKGWSSITLSDDVLALLEERAKRNKRTIPKEIEWLVESFGRR